MRVLDLACKGCDLIEQYCGPIDHDGLCDVCGEENFAYDEDDVDISILSDKRIRFHGPRT